MWNSLIFSGFGLVFKCLLYKNIFFLVFSTSRKTKPREEAIFSQVWPPSDALLFHSSWNSETHLIHSLSIFNCSTSSSTQPWAMLANVSAVQAQSSTHLNFWQSAPCTVYCIRKCRTVARGNKIKTDKIIEDVHAKDGCACTPIELVELWGHMTHHSESVGLHYVTLLKFWG